MSLNFFKADCQHPPISETSFGLCDDQNGTRAYHDTAHPDLWIAEVKNDGGLAIVFTAIDKCVLQDHEYVERGRCDGMITTEEHLYLVELKDKNPPWQAQAIEQLESTVEMLMEHHDISGFKKRKAFACNKRKERFVVIDNEINKAFYRRTSFRLDIQAKILVI